MLTDYSCFISPAFNIAISDCLGYLQLIFLHDLNQPVGTHCLHNLFPDCNKSATFQTHENTGFEIFFAI
jgi:hypothetical protein